MATYEVSASAIAADTDDGDGLDARRAPRQRGPLARLEERGMISAEWAVGIVAAIASAGVLIAVVTNGAVQEGILNFLLRVIGAFATYMGRL